MAKALYYFLLQLALLLSLSKAQSLILEPQLLDAFNPIILQSPVRCNYTVTITTSCNSPEENHDQISLAFGDGSGNQVYASPLLDWTMKAFVQCNSATFHLGGPCTSQICYVYLYRNGPDPWIPGSVKIYGYNSFPPNFNFYKPVPNGTWTGFNHCDSESSARPRQVPGWLLYPIVAVFASLLL